MRRIAVGIVVAAVCFVLATPAGAHVEVEPAEAHHGGYASVIFTVPSHPADTTTSKVEITFPEEHAIPLVSYLPIPGWTVTVQKRALAEPLTVGGQEYTEAVASVTWEGTIEPDGEAQLPMSLGPLPDEDVTLEFPTLQYFANGDVTRWIESTPEGGAEPESPAPTLMVVAPSEDEHGDEAAATDEHAEESAGADAADQATGAESDDHDSEDSDAITIVAIVAAVVGWIVAIWALLRKRKTA